MIMDHISRISSKRKIIDNFERKIFFTKEILNLTSKLTRGHRGQIKPNGVLALESQRNL